MNDHGINSVSLIFFEVFCEFWLKKWSAAVKYYLDVGGTGRLRESYLRQISSFSYPWNCHIFLISTITLKSITYFVSCQQH